MLSERLRDLLNTRQISLQQLADMSDLPLETVRNVYYGRAADPKISTVMKMAKALNMSVNCFMGQCSHTASERALLQHYRMCGNHGKSIIELVAKYEALSMKAERDATDKHSIPCLVPHGDIRKGIVYDNCETISVETSVKEAYVAIQMTSNDLLPKYCKGDILLFENRFPDHKEYAAFYKQDRAYIRKFLEEENGYRLKCLHQQGEDIILKRMNELEYIGTCVGVIRA